MLKDAIHEPRLRPKVWGVGLSRTGTTSLGCALGRLGWRTIHLPWFILRNTSPWVEARFAVNQLAAKWLPWTPFPHVLPHPGNQLILRPDKIAPWEAMSDTPIARFYAELDILYPGSKFIFTTRPVEDWIRSCRRHFAPGRFAQWRYAQLHLDLYEGLEFGEERFRRAFSRHQTELRRYFASRPGDFLEIDFTAGQGWPELCGFLGVPQPAEPFPRANAG